LNAVYLVEGNDMKIGINVTWMTPGHVGGMEWYVRNLIDQLGMIDPDNKYVLVTAPNNANTFRRPSKNWKKVVYFGYENAPMNYRVSLVALQQRSKAYKVARWIYHRLRLMNANIWRGKLNDLIEHENIDIWFCPLIYALPLDTSVPVVITIPDLQQEYYPDFFNKDEQAFRAMGYQYSCNTATAIIGISDHVANEIQKLYHIDSSRVFGIPLALEYSYQVSPHVVEQLKNKVRVKYRLDDDYIFYPANGWPHKNHEQLIEAIHLLHQGGCCVKLVLTGYAIDLQDRLRPLLYKYDLQDAVRHLGHVERQEVIGLYAASSMLVFPSLFEGFGLPLLEAMHFGVPVACSRIGSLPDVGGDAAMYFDPNSAQDIANAIQRLLSDTKLRAQLVNAGKEQVSRFNYATTASQTLAVFEQIRDGSLSKPNTAPFCPVIPHNWLKNGQGRWYFRSTALKKIILKVVQPIPVRELAEQHIEVFVNQKKVLGSSIEAQCPYEFVIPIDSNGADFYRLDIIASSKFEVHGEALSIQVQNITIVESGDRELALVK
jgi:glycosyltransferase involved in cell wall biosynthesis